MLESIIHRKLQSLFTEKLKKENKVEEATKVLDEAYNNGIYEPSSYETEEDEEYADFDKLLTLQDLVRKAKYLQEIGKIDESLKYLDELIKSTSSRANYSVWEIDELSNIHNHKAIVLKKEKRFVRRGDVIGKTTDKFCGGRGGAVVRRWT